MVRKETTERKMAELEAQAFEDKIVQYGRDMVRARAYCACTTLRACITLRLACLPFN